MFLNSEDYGWLSKTRSTSLRMPSFSLDFIIPDWFENSIQYCNMWKILRTVVRFFWQNLTVYRFLTGMWSNIVDCTANYNSLQIIYQKMISFIIVYVQYSRSDNLEDPLIFIYKHYDVVFKVLTSQESLSYRYVVSLSQVKSFVLKTF